MKHRSASKSKERPASALSTEGVSAGENQAPTVVTPTPEEVADRAYLNYENHGAADGHDVEDWLRAEGELIAERQHAVITH
jgi:hypothetical protein